MHFIDRYLNNVSPNSLHIKYPQFAQFNTLDTKPSHNTPQISNINKILNKRTTQFYKDNNIFNYLDTTWHAKSHRIILPKDGLLSSSSLKIPQLIQKCLRHSKIPINIPKWMQSNISHINIVNTIGSINPSQLASKNSRIKYYYVDLAGFMYNINTHINAWNGRDVTIYTIPCWSLGIWIEVKGSGNNNVSRRQYITIIDNMAKYIGIILAGYHAMMTKHTHDPDFFEMLEVFAFNHCYTLATDLGLTISPRYINSFGGPQEFIFTDNRYIPPMYPPLTSAYRNKQSNNSTSSNTNNTISKKNIDSKMLASNLMMTNVGVYSITKPKDTRIIVSTIKKECERTFGQQRTLDKLTITDGTAGVGGDTIAFSLAGFNGVNSCEIVPEHCRVIENNVRVFGLEDKVHIVCGDFIENYTTLKQDIIYLDAPWGGVGYGDNGADLTLFGGKLKFISFVHNIIKHKSAKLIVLKVPMEFNEKQLSIVYKKTSTSKIHISTAIIYRIKLVLIRL